MISRRALIAGAAGLVASPALAFPVIQSSPRRLDQIIRKAGAWDNCALALDAADARSYITGQTWTDLSDGARNFVRGADGTASTDDPTFNGTPGGLTEAEFFGLDGGDFFTKSTANGTYFNGLHRNAASWGLFAAVYVPDIAAVPSRFFATRTGSATSTGVLFAITALEALQLSVSNGAANVNFASTAALIPNAWNLFGISVVINGASFFFLNGTVNTFTATVSSPSAGDSASTARIGADGAGVAPMPNGTRLGAFSMFSTAPSQEQMHWYREALRGRYGI